MPTNSFAIWHVKAFYLLTYLTEENCDGTCGPPCEHIADRRCKTLLKYSFDIQINCLFGLVTILRCSVKI